MADEDTNMTGSVSGSENGASHNTSYFQQVLFSLAQGQDLVNQALAHLLTNPTPVRAPQASTKENKSEPDQYDGSAEKFDDFISQLFVSFSGAPMHFSTEASKVWFALGHMKKGTANVWANAKIEEIKRGEYFITTYDNFEVLLREVFEDPNKRQTAQMKIEKLVQGSRTADDFFAQFDLLKAKAGYNDEAYIRLLRINLSRRIVDDIYHGTLPTTYQGWKSAALKADHKFRELDNVRSATGMITVNKPRVEEQSWRKRVDLRDDARGQQSTAARPVEVGSGGGPVFGGGGGNLPPAIPMDVDRTRGGARFMSRRCYICNSPQHLAKDCPRRKAQVIRSIWMDLDDANKELVMEELGMKGKVKATCTIGSGTNSGTECESRSTRPTSKVPKPQPQLVDERPPKG